MLDGNETWPMKKENKMALQQAEMRIIRWICDVKVQVDSSVMLVSDIAIFVLKRDVKLQLTNSSVMS